MTKTTSAADGNSLMAVAMRAAGTHAWILRTIYDTLTYTNDDVAHTLRNVRACAIRAAIKAAVCGPVKVPAKREAVIAMAVAVVKDLRAEGFSTATTVAKHFA